MTAIDGLLEDWRRTAIDAAVLAACEARLARHGDTPRWREALAALPVVTADQVSLGDTVSAATDAPLSAARAATLEQALRGLVPWRKGPFSLFGVHIDSEWRSDYKWRRVAPHVELDGKTVLDVGGGNGYFGWRMLAAGARAVMGIDPSVLFVMQHAAIAHYLGDTLRSRHTVLPLALEDLPADPRFDAVFSMGVIYHRRDPVDHLRRLHRLTRETLVLESLVVTDRDTLVPDTRYARMRNVWWIPSPERLVSAVEAVGFRDADVVDLTPTTSAEQRTTAWMPFESLRDALDPADPTRTVEGYPAPMRAVIIARR